VAFIKLRLYKNATEELTTLGNLDEPNYLFETYPELYPSLKGCFIPFSLRILQAELPAYQGRYFSDIFKIFCILLVVW
jgi:hypothetical protein